MSVLDFISNLLNGKVISGNNNFTLKIRDNARNISTTMDR
jgi:hypothetical protein